MSETRLNLVDSRYILHGIIHGSVADSAVAALSAEPETIKELVVALARYIRPLDDCNPFSGFSVNTEINKEPWDAGIVIIDLAARVVATESTYSRPGFQGEVHYHDGHQGTNLCIPYQIPEDWKFVYSVAEYEYWCKDRRNQRAAAGFFDSRAILYGRPLLEFIVTECSAVDVNAAELHNASIREPDWAKHIDTLEGETLDITKPLAKTSVCVPTSDNTIQASVSTTSVCDPTWDDNPFQKAHAAEISAIHARWLTTPREDLRGRSPRDVLLEKQDLIDYDLHTRALQWSMQGEGPPPLSRDSHAYKFAGFGTHEWVVYYDLVRLLLWKALQTFAEAQAECNESTLVTPDADGRFKSELLARIALLEKVKTDWLEQPQQDYDNKTPANIIDNERRRLPEAMAPSELIIDEHCEICRMQAQEAEMGYGPGFWHLDSSQMDDDFAFSSERTHEEWEAENRRREEFNQEFNRRWEERQQRIASGEVVNDEFSLDWVKM